MLQIPSGTKGAAVAPKHRNISGVITFELLKRFVDSLRAIRAMALRASGREWITVYTAPSFSILTAIK